MNQDRSGRSIRPADFESPDRVEQRKQSEPANARPVKALVVIALLLVAAVGTFYLPDRATSPGGNQNQEQVTEVVAEIEEQPFSDAQLLRARREAQEILAELVRAQNQLEDLRVDDWAGASYTDLMSVAQSGDVAYQERDFELALQHYSQALESARELLDTRQQNAESLLQQADRAFAAGDREGAESAYELALLLDPDSAAASAGLERTSVMPEVTELKVAAAEARAEGNWQRAQEALQQAVELDPRDEELAEELAEAEEQIRQRDFRAALARGFNALADADYTAARSAFGEADRIIPDHPQVEDAMLQVNSAAETRQRNQLIDEALEAEANEEWQLAVEKYEELLERDDSQVDARVGLLRAQARQELDQQIDTILADPLSLQSDANWEAAERTLAEARAIINKTPGLVQQINQLEQVIQKARTPVRLTLLSDGQTQIEIYRVGTIGKLTEHTVSIYPGEYVVVGRKSGYRDVRKELEVTGDNPNITLRVEATESIN